MRQYHDDFLVCNNQATLSIPVASSTKESSKGTADAGAIDGILQTRTYDMYITYDKYYQTPRLWLYGYNEVCK